MPNSEIDEPTAFSNWLLEVVAECLKVPAERVNRNVLLTRYGLDSCNAVQLTTAIAHKLQCSVPESLLLFYPSIATLESYMVATQSGSQPTLTLSDDAGGMQARLLTDSMLPEDVRPENDIGSTTIQHVFLTGTTGFLGAFLLHTLLRETKATVHCLVRQSLEMPLDRVRRNLTNYGLWDDGFEFRLQACVGDLSLPQLGLSWIKWSELARQIDVIYHCAATINWVLPYDAMRSANVMGTVELLRLACQEKTKPFHFVSTIATCHTTLDVGEVTEQDESLAYIGGNYLGYAQSKCVAESLVRRANERGLPATIHRPSLIIGDGTTSQNNPDDLLSSMIRGCIDMGAAPDLDWILDCCTVEFVAQAIVALSLPSKVNLRVTHLVNPTGRHWREVVLWMNIYGYAITLVPYRQWLAELRISASSASHPLYRLQGFFFARPKAGCSLTLPELYEESRCNIVSSWRTDEALHKRGLRCPDLNAELLDRNFSALKINGAIPDVRRDENNSPTAKTSLDKDFFETILRPYYNDSSLEIRELSLCKIAEQSITTELTSWRHASNSGLWRGSLEFAISGDDETQLLELVVKVKPVDRQVIAVAEKVAALCDPKLGEAISSHRDRLGILGCHRREINIYQQQDARFVNHVPAVYGTVESSERCEWLLVLESLAGMKLLDCADDLAQWTSRDIEDAIQGLSQLHSLWYLREDELAVQPWLNLPISTQEMVDMANLWHALAEYSWKYFSEWLDLDAKESINHLMADVANWWQQLDQMPKTLIHNDFNPRNIALRNRAGKSQLCAYDWELAAIGVPQHDLAEFLCFVLPLDSSQETIMHYLEVHRAGLSLATERQIELQAWRAGFRLSLKNLILNRFPMYCLMHTFRRQAFLPKVIKTWRQLYGMFEDDAFVR